MPKYDWTEKQGQYLAFIYNYSVIHGQPPAEADMQRFFGVTPPAVHQMVLKLEEKGLISRVPRQARTIRVLVEPDQLPVLKDRRQTMAVAVACGSLTRYSRRYFDRVERSQVMRV